MKLKLKLILYLILWNIIANIINDFYIPKKYVFSWGYVTGLLSASIVVFGTLKSFKFLIIKQEKK